MANSPMHIEDKAPSIKFYLSGPANSVRSMSTVRPSLKHLRAAINEGFVHDADLAKNGAKPGHELTSITVGNDIPIDESTDPLQVKDVAVTGPDHHQVKFGWIRGVLIRCILSILGTMIYLRLGWVAGRAGIIVGVVIVAISTLIVLITALSMCALCTNGEIYAGGAYFMLSRALGPEFGGSMGVVFALADAVASAMNVVGFSETIVDLLTRYHLKMVDRENDVRIIGAITMLTLFTVVMISVSWEAKTELILLFVVIVSYTSFLVGTVIPPSERQMAGGMTGYKWSTFRDNLLPEWKGETFVTVFSIYFPSITGIMAGAGISGELREPDKALPKGTLLGIAITTTVYISGIVLTGATVLRDASGSTADLHAGTLTACLANNTCKGGLHNNYAIMELEGAYGPLIIAGIAATSISSALTLIVTSPRTIQALAKDKIFPYISILARESGKDKEPRIAYCLVLLIALIIISIGQLNLIAPLISNFYLASFALINYACFDGSLNRSPGWRPAFKYYNMWVALCGSGMCIVAMFVMQWATALATIAVMFFLYVYVLRSKPTVNWGSSGDARLYRNVLKGMFLLAYTEEHVKNYRPSILLLSGNPVARPCLVDFFANITKDIGLLVCGDVIKLSKEEQERDISLRKRSRKIQYWLKKRRVRAFFNPVLSPTFDFGCKALMQLAGLGNLRPNIIAFGYKHNWTLSRPHELEQFFMLIHEIFRQQFGLAILYKSGGTDFTEKILFGKRSGELGQLLNFLSETLESNYDVKITKDRNKLKRTASAKPDNMFDRMNNDKLEAPQSQSNESMLQKSKFGSETNLVQSLQSQYRIKRMESQLSHISVSELSVGESVLDDQAESTIKSTARRKVSVLQRELDEALDEYRVHREGATIDVWWIHDDGGLTLLVAHLLTVKRSYVSGASLRLFTYASKPENAEYEKESLEKMLAKFRIKCDEVTLVPSAVGVEPNPTTVELFEKTINVFRSSVSGEEATRHPFYYITDEQLELLQHKTNLYLKTREYVQELSSSADVIVITMPVPRKGREPASLYFAWLEMLSKNLFASKTSCVLLIRGNQQDVLTFYS